MANQAKEEWEKAMAELAQEEPELLQHFQKLSEAAGKVGMWKSIYIFAKHRLLLDVKVPPCIVECIARPM